MWFTFLKNWYKIKNIYMQCEKINMWRDYL